MSARCRQEYSRKPCFNMLTNPAKGAVWGQKRHMGTSTVLSAVEWLQPSRLPNTSCGDICTPACKLHKHQRVSHCFGQVSDSVRSTVLTVTLSKKKNPHFMPFFCETVHNSLDNDDLKIKTNRQMWLLWRCRHWWRTHKRTHTQTDRQIRTHVVRMMW